MKNDEGEVKKNKGTLTGAFIFLEVKLVTVFNFYVSVPNCITMVLAMQYVLCKVPKLVFL